MPDTRPRFIHALAQQFPSPQIKRKGLLGRKVVPLGPLLTVGGFLFETGAMLGHAFRDRLDTFVVPFSAEEGRPEAVDFLRSQGASVARVLQSATTINELFIMHEMLVAEPGRPSNEWAQWLMAQGDEAVPVDFAAQITPVFGARGAGFGALFPGDLERLYAGSYGNVDVAAWKQGHAAGLDIPAEPPHFPSFVTKRQETVEGFKDFCAQIFPELLQPLRLAR